MLSQKFTLLTNVRLHLNIAHDQAYSAFEQCFNDFEKMVGGDGWLGGFNHLPLPNLNVFIQYSLSIQNKSSNTYFLQCNSAYTISIYCRISTQVLVSTIKIQLEDMCH